MLCVSRVRWSWSMWSTCAFQRTQCDARDALTPPHPSRGQEHLPAALRKARQGRCLWLPERLACPGELTRAASTQGPPSPLGVPLVCVLSLIRTRKVVRIFIMFSGLSRLLQLFLCSSCPGVAGGPFRLALHPLGTSPQCFQLAVFQAQDGQASIRFLCPALGSTRTGVFRLQVWAF